MALLMDIGLHPLLQERILARHDFFMEQVKSRVFESFFNLEEDADAAANDAWQRFMSQTSHGEDDPGDYVDAATEAGIDFYEYGMKMKKQVTLACLATLYHEWEKDVRSHLEREIQRWGYRTAKQDQLWTAPVSDILDFLERQGWRIRGRQWYVLLDACRIIVNVYKHGKGSSFNDLKKTYPQYLKCDYQLFEADYESLEITEQEFDELGGAVRQFWQDFPRILKCSAQ